MAAGGRLRWVTPLEATAARLRDELAVADVTAAVAGLAEEVVGGRLATALAPEVAAVAAAAYLAAGSLGAGRRVGGGGETGTITLGEQYVGAVRAVPAAHGGHLLAHPSWDASAAAVAGAALMEAGTRRHAAGGWLDVTRAWNAPAPGSNGSNGDDNTGGERGPLPPEEAALLAAAKALAESPRWRSTVVRLVQLHAATERTVEAASAAVRCGCTRVVAALSPVATDAWRRVCSATAAAVPLTPRAAAVARLLALAWQRGVGVRTCALAAQAFLALSFLRQQGLPTSLPLAATGIRYVTAEPLTATDRAWAGRFRVLGALLAVMVVAEVAKAAVGAWADGDVRAALAACIAPTVPASGGAAPTPHAEAGAVELVGGVGGERSSSQHARTPSPPARSCALCLAPREAPTATLCGHIFCWHCAVRACMTKPECPLCRAPCLPQQLVRLHGYR